MRWQLLRRIRYAEKRNPEIAIIAVGVAGRSCPEACTDTSLIRHIPAVFCVGYLSDGQVYFNKIYITDLCTQTIGPAESFVCPVYTSAR